MMTQKLDPIEEQEELERLRRAAARQRYEEEQEEQHARTQRLRENWRREQERRAEVAAQLSPSRAAELKTENDARLEAHRQNASALFRLEEEAARMRRLSR